MSIECICTKETQQSTSYWCLLWSKRVSQTISIFVHPSKISKISKISYLVLHTTTMSASAFCTKETQQSDQPLTDAFSGWNVFLKWVPFLCIYILLCSLFCSQYIRDAQKWNPFENHVSTRESNSINSLRSVASATTLARHSKDFGLWTPTPKL